MGEPAVTKTVEARAVADTAVEAGVMAVDQEETTETEEVQVSVVDV